MGNTYINKTSTIYLKLKFYLILCTFFKFLLNMATPVKGPETLGERTEETFYTNTASISLATALLVLVQQ